jgi:hypothetical protein
MESPVRFEWTLEGKEGWLRLPNGAALKVAVRGPRAAVRWNDGALVLHRDSSGTSPAAEEGDADDTIELVVIHSMVNPDHVWVPHLAPEQGHVIGDAVFRSPAIVLSDASIALALVPDLDDVSVAHGWRAWMDYDHPASTMTLAAGAYEETGHVFFLRRPLPVGTANVALRLHVVTSCRTADRENPYGMAARWLWNRWGRPRLHAGPNAPSLHGLMDHVVRWAFASGWSDSVWQPIDLPDRTRAGAPVFIVDVTRHPSVPPERRRWREPRSIWNQAWFSTQRCANGLLRFARQTASADLEERARQMTRVALAAPQEDGLFPSVLIKDESEDAGGWRWSNSNRRPRAVSEDACHLVDAAFTCRMLVEWHALTGEGQALHYARRFGERLARLQRPSGAFPGWVEPDGRIASELAEGPESAVSVSLLFDLAAQTGESAGGTPDWREMAVSGLSFLESVARRGQWEDFETYYSCAPWGAPELIGRRVARNGVFKQNTLSIFWCAEAFLRGWRATRKRRYLDLARRCVDELSLYQAVWDAPFLPAPTHGGFGVMNADAEWNDARQSLFAPLYLDLGREIADDELTERAVSALRASFSMLYCPENAALARAYEKRFPFFGPESYGFMMENQGHDRAEPIGTFTIFTWGNGSALATAATVRDLFPEVAPDCGI